MGKARSILLVEDKEDIRRAITGSIHRIDNTVDVKALTKENIKSFENNGSSNESVIADAINSEYGDVGLIVIDHDLTDLQSSISESSITAAAHALAIPVLRYHRAPASESGILESLWQLNSKIYSINYRGVLDLDNDEFPKFAVNILDGFFGLKSAYAKLGSEVKKRGAPGVLANILGHPEHESHIAAYSEGVSFLNEIIIVREAMLKDPGSSEFREQLTRRIPYILGYWLYNSILRFPGVLLNDVAAASYLDIDCEDFARNDVCEEFEYARYNGPFSKHSKYWWRPLLDDIYLDHDHAKDYLKEKGVTPEVDCCRCHVSNKCPAGFYDLFNDKPISKEKSVGRLSWVPSGADLARVDKEKYEEIEPILGV